MGTFYSVTGPINTDKDYDVVKRVPEGFVLYHKEHPTDFVFFEGQVVKPKNGVIVNQPDSNWILEDYESYVKKFFPSENYFQEDFFFESDESKTAEEYSLQDIQKTIEKIKDGEDIFEISSGEGSLVFLNTLLNIGSDYKFHPNSATFRSFFTMFSFLSIGFLLDKGYLNSIQLQDEGFDLTYLLKQEEVFEDLKKFLSQYIHGVSDKTLSIITYLVLAKYDTDRYSVSSESFLKFYSLYKDRFKGLNVEDSPIKLSRVFNNLLPVLVPKTLDAVSFRNINKKKTLIKVMFEINDFLKKEGYGVDFSSEESKIYLRTFFEELLHKTLATENPLYKKSMPVFTALSKDDLVRENFPVILSGLGLLAAMDEASLSKFEKLFSEMQAAFESFAANEDEVSEDIYEARYVEALDKLTEFSWELLSGFLTQKNFLSDKEVLDLVKLLSFFNYDSEYYYDIYETEIFEKLEEIRVENLSAEDFLRKFIFNMSIKAPGAFIITAFLQETKAITLLYPELAKYTDISLLRRELEFLEAKISYHHSDSEALKLFYETVKNLAEREPKTDIPELNSIVHVVNEILLDPLNGENFITEKITPMLVSVLEKYKNDPAKYFEIVNFSRELLDFLSDIATKLTLPIVNKLNDLILYMTNDLSDLMLLLYDKALEIEQNQDNDENKLLYRIATTSFLTYFNKNSFLAKKLLITSDRHFELINISSSHIHTTVANLHNISDEDRSIILSASRTTLESVGKIIRDISDREKVSKTTVAALESLLFYLEDFIRNDLKVLYDKYSKLGDYATNSHLKEIERSYKEIYTTLFAIRSNLLFNSLTNIFEEETPSQFPLSLNSRYKMLLVDTVRRLTENEDLIDLINAKETNLISLAVEEESEDPFNTQKKLDYIRLVKDEKSGTLKVRVRLPIPEVASRNAENLSEEFSLKELRDFFFDKEFETLLSEEPEKFGLLDILHKELALRALDPALSKPSLNYENKFSTSTALSSLYELRSAYGLLSINAPTKKIAKAFRSMAKSKFHEIKKELSKREKMKLIDKLRLALKEIEVQDYELENQGKYEISAKVKINENEYNIKIREIGYHIYLDAIIEFYSSLGAKEEEILGVIDKLAENLENLKKYVPKPVVGKLVQMIIPQEHQDKFLKTLVKKVIENYVEGKSALSFTKTESIPLGIHNSYHLERIRTTEEGEKVHTSFETPFSSLMASSMLDKVKPFLGDFWFNFIKKLSEKYVDLIVSPNGWYNTRISTVNMNPFAFAFHLGSPIPYTLSELYKLIEKYQDRKDALLRDFADYDYHKTEEGLTSEEVAVSRFVRPFTATLIHEIGHVLSNIYHKINPNEASRVDPFDESSYIPQFLENFFITYQKPRIKKFFEEISKDLDMTEGEAEMFADTFSSTDKPIDVLYTEYGRIRNILKLKLEKKGESLDRRIKELMKELEIMNFYSFFNIREVPSTVLEKFFLLGEDEFRKKYPSYYKIAVRLINDYIREIDL